MNDRFFLDTNVFVYEVDPRDRTKCQRASELIDSAVGSKRGVVSYQVVQEFFNVALTRFAKPFSLSEAEDYLSLTFKPILAVHSSPRLFADALQVQTQYRFSWYDSLIVAAAQQAECSVLYTEDMQPGQRIGNLKIENPFR
ncbi:MAG TPA: PIN domain-containing protein [Candidatus Acidoferrales bacterium]|nr:PIN domain-containing protein [Candidatus Acidoferrales bacterium]